MACRFMMLGEQPEGCSRSSLIPQPQEDLQATNSLREDVVAVGLCAELDVGPAELSLMFSSNETRVKKTRNLHFPSIKHSKSSGSFISTVYLT